MVVQGRPSHATNKICTAGEFRLIYDIQETLVSFSNLKQLKEW